LEFVRESAVKINITPLSLSLKMVIIMVLIAQGYFFIHLDKYIPDDDVYSVLSGSQGGSWRQNIISIAVNHLGNIRYKVLYLHYDILRERRS
jgi:hypothetical protein